MLRRDTVWFSAREARHAVMRHRLVERDLPIAYRSKVYAFTSTRPTSGVDLAVSLSLERTRSRRTLRYCALIPAALMIFAAIAISSRTKLRNSAVDIGIASALRARLAADGATLRARFRRFERPLCTTPADLCGSVCDGRSTAISSRITSSSKAVGRAHRDPPLGTYAFAAKLAAGESTPLRASTDWLAHDDHLPPSQLASAARPNPVANVLISPAVTHGLPYA